MREIKQCDECKSPFFKEASTMTQLCPSCAYYLYGYEPCNHHFIDGYCSICGWDGSVSKYIQRLIIDNAQDT